MAIEVSGIARAQALDALAAQPEGLAVLRALGQFDLGLAIERGHMDLPAQRRRDHAHRCGAVQVIAIALEDLMWLDPDLDVQVARRAAVGAGLAVASRTNTHAFVDAGRDLDLERLVLLDAALAMTGHARLGDHLAHATAGRAGLLDAEETLAHRDRTGAVASAAHLRAGARLGAGAVAGVAGFVGGNAYLRFLASGAVLERDLHRVRQVVAAKHLLPTAAATTATTRATRAAKDVAKDVAESFCKATHAIRAAARAKAATHVGVDAGVAVLVVGGTLLRVGEHLVGLLGLLELLFGLLGIVTLIAVRVVLHRELAISLLDVFVGGVFGHTQSFVVIALCHRFIRHAAASGSNKNAAPDPSCALVPPNAAQTPGFTPAPQLHRCRVTSFL